MILWFIHNFIPPAFIAPRRADTLCNRPHDAATSDRVSYLSATIYIYIYIHITIYIYIYYHCHHCYRSESDFWRSVSAHVLWRPEALDWFKGLCFFHVVHERPSLGGTDHNNNSNDNNDNNDNHFYCYMHTYIYIYIEREREREIDTQTSAGCPAWEARGQSRFFKGGCSGKIYMMLYTSLLHNATPIHCTPFRLHPPFDECPDKRAERRVYIYIYIYIYI